LSSPLVNLIFAMFILLCHREERSDEAISDNLSAIAVPSLRSGSR